MKILQIANLFLALALLILIPFPVAGATWYIKSDGSGDAPTIQAGINLAASGDTVLLAPGTFSGPGNFDIDFSGKAMVLTSENGPYSTIIDCQNNGRGVTFQNGEGAGSILSGLTIKNGQTGQNGGGIFCKNSSPQLLNNIIVWNSANKHGGGIYIRGAASPSISNNTIVENSAGWQGGGITAEFGATPAISNNIIAFSTQGEGIACLKAGTMPILFCNDIYGNAGGDAICGLDIGSNIFLDPEFCGITSSGNYYIQSDSPCTPLLSPCGQLIGALPVFCGTTPTNHKTWGEIKSIYLNERSSE